MRRIISKVVSSMSLTAICLLALSGQPVAADPCPELTFLPPVYFPAGLETNGLATADLNGDGHVDLVAANEGSGTVTIRFGDGAGTFASSTQLAVTSPSGVAVADFNADGILDLVMSNRSNSRITVRLGTGGGAFATPVQTIVGSSPSGVALGDFNGDGNLDVVTSNGGTGTISLLLGNGAGSFPAATPFSTRGSGAFGIVTGDFNGDGLLDVGTANRGTANISVMIGDGAGGFSSTAVYPAGTQPNKITTGDFNGDGWADLATANVGSNNLTVRINNGAGGFPTAFMLASGPQPFAVATGDLDADGNIDLIATSRGTGTVSVYRGSSGGTFSAPIDIAVNAGARAVAVADLNDDGLLDISAGIDSSTVGVLINGCVTNTAPTITAAAVSRQQDAASSISEIATVGDGQDDPGDLVVTIDGGTSSTLNGVTVSNISVDAAGSVTANVVASCGAADASFNLTVTDSEGLSASASLNVDVTNETTPPVIAKGMPLPDITVFLPLNSPDLSMPVNFNSPAATDNCTQSPTVMISPDPGSVFGVGSTMVVVTATDELNNTSTATFRVNVLFNFGGFTSPIESFPMLNIVAAGSAVPVKFSLSGDKGLNVLANGYPASSPVDCDENEPGTVIEETSSPGETELTYDAVTDQYKYVWKTSKDWRRTCRILIVKLADGTEHYAKFSFR